jgi:hypothetical protein
MFTPEDRLVKHNELAEQLRGKHSSKKAAKAAAAAAQAAVTADTTPAVSAEGHTAVSTAIPAKRKRGRPPKNATSTVDSSTTQKRKHGTNGKKGKAANSAKKRTPQEISEETVAVDSDRDLTDTSSDSESDSSDSDHGHRPKKRRAEEPYSDSDYDAGAGANKQVGEPEGESRRPQRARRAPTRFAMNAYVDSDSD